ncbi:MAG: hypothetical protein ACYDAY_02045 [Candidatus Dormibacteria bacterium]
MVATRDRVGELNWGWVGIETDAYRRELLPGDLIRFGRRLRDKSRSQTLGSGDFLGRTEGNEITDFRHAKRKALLVALCDDLGIKLDAVLGIPDRRFRARTAQSAIFAEALAFPAAVGERVAQPQLEAPEVAARHVDELVAQGMELSRECALSYAAGALGRMYEVLTAGMGWLDEVVLAESALGDAQRSELRRWQSDLWQWAAALLLLWRQPEPAWVCAVSAVSAGKGAGDNLRMIRGTVRVMEAMTRTNWRRHALMAGLVWIGDWLENRPVDASLLTSYGALFAAAFRADITNQYGDKTVTLKVLTEAQEIAQHEGDVYQGDVWFSEAILLQSMMVATVDGMVFLSDAGAPLAGSRERSTFDRNLKRRLELSGSAPQFAVHEATFRIEVARYLRLGSMSEKRRGLILEHLGHAREVAPEVFRESGYALDLLIGLLEQKPGKAKRREGALQPKVTLEPLVTQLLVDLGMPARKELLTG